MKEGWEIKNLNEIAEVGAGNSAPQKKELFVNGSYPFIRTSDVGQIRKGFINSSADNLNEEGIRKLKLKKKGTILFPKSGASTFLNHRVMMEIDGYVSSHLATIKAKETFALDRYLLYFLVTIDAKDLMQDIAYPSLKISDIGAIQIPIPPLPEQQHIVSILDKAFAAIDKAKYNAEQNLFNANELFENSAQGIFTQKGIDWEEKLLGDFAEFRNGINYTKGSKGEKIKIVGVKDFQDSYWVPENDLVEVSLDGKINETDLLREGDILAVRSNGNPQLIGRTLLAGIINEKVSHSGFTIRIRLNSKIVNPNYLCHFMKIQQTRKTLVESGNGVGIRSLNQGSLSSLKIPFPKSLKEQEMIIDKVDSIAEQSQKLKDIYQRKINDFEELKKSILQKAFAGELTSSVSTSMLATKVIPLQKVEGISPTDLQAGITALALQKHIEQDQQHSFHHVKAEKIVHLSEYILNIDLNRNPVKDAAGPNDFPHAKKVESRARKAGFYSVYKNGEFYDYRQGNSFNKVIQKAQNSLGEKADTLSQIIDILAPMSTQQAEIVATIYAAWNNLLLSGIEFTDENIVTEARENWHKNKLSIERIKFCNALEWMKKHELLIPKGNGKVVETKVREKK